MSKGSDSNKQGNLDRKANDGRVLGRTNSLRAWAKQDTVVLDGPTVVACGS